jgi:hypothetical protein
VTFAIWHASGLLADRLERPLLAAAAKPAIA